MNDSQIHSWIFLSISFCDSPASRKQIAEVADDVMALADNAFGSATKIEPGVVSSRSHEIVLENTLRDYRKHLDRLSYELEKIR